jgi:hypothetical protein
MFKYCQNKRNDQIFAKYLRYFYMMLTIYHFYPIILLKYIYIEIFFNFVQKHVTLTAT